jgi:peroxiredoxin
MLRAVMKDNPHREVKGAACLALADYLKMAKETTESRLVKISIGGEQSLDPAKLTNVERVKDRGLSAVAAESETLFQTVIDRYADIRLECNYPQQAAELARGELFVLRNLGIGQKAPEIVGRDIRGKTMKLSDYHGKVVVLDFGSHRSCGVCRQMYPYLRSMVEKFRDKPFALLGISVEDDIKELVALAEKGENTWPIWWDGENLEGPIASQWVIRSMPTFFVLDEKGVIRNKGFIQPVEIEATVNMLLNEMSAPRP